MRLRHYLKKTLSEQIERHKEGINLTEGSLKVLEQTNVGRADYVVRLRSLWEKEGEMTVTTGHHGTLKDAIEKAEENFKSVNHRGDVQASYTVRILLGDASYHIPEEYWREFREKH
jgi:hypothetical protein